MREPLASESKLIEFEKQFRPIPEDMRWLLKNVGGGYVTAEPTYNIEKLFKAHRDYELSPNVKSFFPVFSLGVDGGGNFFGLEDGGVRVLIWDHDFGGVYELAPTFDSFILDGPNYEGEALPEFTPQN